MGRGMRVGRETLEGQKRDRGDEGEGEDARRD